MRQTSKNDGPLQKSALSRTDYLKGCNAGVLLFNERISVLEALSGQRQT